MLVTITGYSEPFFADGAECRNITCTVNGHSINVTVPLPFTLAKAKAELIKYCTVHKQRLGIGDTVLFEPQSFDVPELDEL